MRDEKKHFHEIDVNMIKNKIVIIDIDGTLVCPSGSDPSDAVHEKVRELEGHNTVYAFSNNFNGTRSRAVADKLGLAYIESPFRKPNPKIINYIKKGEQKLVMIGDKYLTDHLFAHFAKGEFIHVDHITETICGKHLGCYSASPANGTVNKSSFFWVQLCHPVFDLSEGDKLGSWYMRLFIFFRLADIKDSH